MTPTDEQTSILDAARATNDSLVIDALAGVGKTATIIECLKVMRQPSSLVLAFNKRIADEMTRRLPPMPRGRIVHVKTLHAVGLWLLKHHYPRLTVDTSASEALIRERAEGAALRVRGAALRLLRLVKDFQYEQALDLDYAFHLGADFGLFDKLQSGHEMQKAVEITAGAYVDGLDLAKRDTIDFPDMGWLPLVLGLDPPSRYKAILIDELQDVSMNQIAMVEKLLATGGRVIGVGDRFQAIYEWRSAVPDEAFGWLTSNKYAKRFPLTITWRCDREIVREAQKLVPDLQPRPDAGPGAVHTIDEDEFLAHDFDVIEGSVFVLSRTNAELLRIALELYKRKVAFNLAQSTEVLRPLKDVLAKIFRSKVATAKDFEQALSAWQMTEMIKAQAAGSSTWAERIEEQFKMLSYAAQYARSPYSIEELLDNIYSYDEMCDITLSTVHKAKGMEASTVFLLKQTFFRYQNRRDRNGNLLPIPQEEINVEYVAITRAKRTLVWVNLNKQDFK